MNYMIMLKAGLSNIFRMNSGLDGRLKTREQPSDEEKATLLAKAAVYALLNRPSPPF
jgi:hypothetical protein